MSQTVNLRVGAFLFDLDGVLTPTAQVHMRAWGEMFDEFLTRDDVGLGGALDVDARPWSDADYHAHVDGKARFDGVRDFLATRGIALPEGSPDDGPGDVTVRGLGARKNDAFNAVLARDGVQAYPGSVLLLDALRDAGTPVAVVSSSRNAPVVLAAAGLADRFEVVVTGATAEERGLPGKPAPDMFLHAAALLGVPSADCVVVEDAVSGVKAGAAGGFRAVVGVDRGAGPDVLFAAGADLVVSDLAELLPADVVAAARAASEQGEA
ncbi:HAD family hydrolase [Nocardioides yefusunii]|uniref:Beta-phosphoglucomutase n=1 Tax=Nocardioides yefusunii TaxID=2500546 RepID=A0ABW1QZZ6_9ACTN|nr:beta-phosphoglucomutase family hydrolase [Nocardioides yefusunii]